MLRKEIQHFVVTNTEIGIYLAVLQCDIHIHRPQVFHIQVQKRADLSVRVCKMLFVRIYIKLSVRLSLLQAKGQLHIGVHLIELLHEIHILCHVRHCLIRCRIRLPRALKGIGQTLELSVQPAVQLLDLSRLRHLPGADSPHFFQLSV